MILLVHFVVLNIISSGYAYNALLIKDYVKYNYVTTILLVSCGSGYESNGIETIKNLQTHGIWINVWDISNELIISDFDYKHFFLRLSHPPCVMVNLDCNQTSAFMAQMSKRIMFHYERNWLMFSASLERSFDILNRQNINVDADILLAVRVEENDESDQYDTYEVFNPSGTRGGRLNVTKLGSWNKKIGLDIPSKQTKIERRRNLTGLTFPAVITVK